MQPCLNPELDGILTDRNLLFHFPDTAYFRGVENERELEKLLHDVGEHFFTPGWRVRGGVRVAGEDFPEFDAAAQSVLPEYEAVAKAFRHNLGSAVSTVAMPFRLLRVGVLERHFDRIHAAERIRSLARYLNESDLQPGEDLDTVRKREAEREALAQIEALVKSEDGQQMLIRDTCLSLLTSLHHGLEHAAAELLQQGLVLLWSAFEVLFRDAFEILLNADPSKVSMLVDHHSTRKRFELERLSLATLVQHGFDLSQRLGSVLVAQQDFSDLPTVKAVYGVLYPSENHLTEALV